MILGTRGAGLMDANFVLDWLAGSDEPELNLDELTNAGNLHNMDGQAGDARHVIVRGDIGYTALVERLLAEHKPCAVVNFAAESHVGRSMHRSSEFFQSDAFSWLPAYWRALKLAVSPRRINGQQLGESLRFFFLRGTWSPQCGNCSA
ncbi:MAG: GDP-mannose 4,6-dehydratase [Proteobacteria bacterium]|nr:GDP-mannose 4,6-dehydratase [Pseudomonadota bacterium]